MVSKMYANENMKKGFAIYRNVEILLHKPVKRSVKERLLNKLFSKQYRALTKEELVSKGLLVDERKVHNDVVDAGEIWIAELLAHKYTGGTTIAAPLLNGLQYIGVGTGTDTNPVQNQVQLKTPLAIKVAATAFNAGANNKFTVSTTFTTGEANGGLVEAGIFANSTPVSALSETTTTNRMFNRTEFAVINKTTDFELTLQWTIEIGTLS